jgi:hypothetical protein
MESISSVKAINGNVIIKHITLRKIYTDEIIIEESATFLKSFGFFNKGIKKYK